MTSRTRPRAFLTVDLEDYRRQEMRDHLGSDSPANPDEVVRQVDLMLAALERHQVRATFFCVGRLVGELPPRIWGDITTRHVVGCHGYEHLRVDRLGPTDFRADLVRAREALEDAIGSPIRSHRAPYFSCDRCHPWFGEVLAEQGFAVDSSMRVGGRFEGAPTFSLPGSGGQITEVPLGSLGTGRKRITIIGGTYLRLFPLPVVRALLRLVERRGGLPVVYLHPYDLDPAAPQLAYPSRYLRARAGDGLRRLGRRSAADKLAALAGEYEFLPVEAVLEEPRTSEADSRGTSPG